MFASWHYLKENITLKSSKRGQAHWAIAQGGKTSPDTVEIDNKTEKRKNMRNISKKEP